MTRRGVNQVGTLKILSRKRSIYKFCWVVLLLLTLPGCLFRRHREEVELNPGDQPDKILYEKATREIARGRFDVGRLTLQTLINTYPDSEYLAKAKLAIADSYYNEGGTSGLTQAEAEYKDFITFFPTAPEAPEAQYRAGMAHYRMMSKSDRDRTEAKLAEAEFKEFLLKYPDSQVMPRVKARLRQVQEVLAQGDFRIAQFYYSKRADPAARSRFQEIADNYPNFSRGDEALWYLGRSLEALRRPDEAATYYARVITEHPLSEYVDPVKERLTALKKPIPRPTRAVLARAQADAVKKPGRDLFSKIGMFLSSAPDVSATRAGPVQLGKPKPATVEMARGAPATPGASSVSATPVGDEALKAGTPVGTSPPPSEASGGDSAPKPAGTEEIRHKSQAPPPATKKKKGFFRKIIKPF
jgi:outer membrane protein assembly factor BamD